MCDGRTPLLLEEVARARTGCTGVDVGCARGLTVGGYAGAIHRSLQPGHEPAVGEIV